MGVKGANRSISRVKKRTKVHRDKKRENPVTRPRPDNKRRAINQKRTRATSDRVGRHGHPLLDTPKNTEEHANHKRQGSYADALERPDKAIQKYTIQTSHIRAQGKGLKKTWIGHKMNKNRRRKIVYFETLQRDTRRTRKEEGPEQPGGHTEQA